MAPRQSSQPAMPGSPSEVPFCQVHPFYHRVEKGSNGMQCHSPRMMSVPGAESSTVGGL
jgi:hypothetical protein